MSGDHNFFFYLPFCVFYFLYNDHIQYLENLKVTQQKSQAKSLLQTYEM